MKTITERRRASLALLSDAERYLREAEEKPLVETARLSALLVISDANSQNHISDRNRDSMDRQLHALISQIGVPSLGDAIHSTELLVLPLPRQTYWHHGEFL